MGVVGVDNTVGGIVAVMSDFENPEPSSQPVLKESQWYQDLRWHEFVLNLEASVVEACAEV